MSILDLFRLDGKVALVTGSNRGLGQAIAVALAEAGADIVGLSQVSVPDAAETAARVVAIGRTYHHLAVDLGQATVADLQTTVDQAVAAAGRLDILVNNAGIIRRTPALDYSEQDWNDVLQINLNAVFFLSQAAARYMDQHGGGKIINIASMLSYQGGVFVPAYTATKHAVMGLTRAFANEWASKKINVNAIAPGYMATDNTSALRADADRSAAILSRIPAGVWGTPDDLKGAAVLLASDAGSYIHGTTIDVDGGWMAR